MRLFTRSDKADTSLGVMERLFYGFGNAGSVFVYMLVSVYMVYFYTNTLALNSGIIGGILMASRIFDGATDLIMGRIVDCTRSKFGKSRCWLIRVCFPYAIAAVLMFAVPNDTTDLVKYIYVFVSYNLLNSVCYTALMVPYNTLCATMTTNQYERGLLGVFSMFANVAAGIVMNATVVKMVDSFGGGQIGWLWAVVCFATVGLIFHLICFFGIKERVGSEEIAKEKAPPVKLSVSVKALLKNKYWVLFMIMAFCVWFAVAMTQTAGIFYADSVLHDKERYSLMANSCSIGQLVCLFLATFVMKKKGKIFTCRFGMGIGFIGAILMSVADTNVPVLIAGATIAGSGCGFAGACIGGMLADIMDYGEWKTRVNAVGLGMAAYSFVLKISYGLANALWGFMLDASGYDPSIEIQPQAAIIAIKAAYAFIPFALFVVGFIVLLPYKLDKEYPEIAKELEARRASE